MKKMRRHDREMSEEFAYQVIDEAPYGVMGLCLDEPYTVPLSIVRLAEDDKNLYFHSAKEGRKLQAGHQVSLTFVSKHSAPSLYSDAEVQAMIDQKEIGKIARTIYTTEFASAHVLGRLVEVQDEAIKAKVLQAIANKYTPQYAKFAEPIIKASVNNTAIYKIEVSEIRGKQKKLDHKTGEEIKGDAD